MTCRKVTNGGTGGTKGAILGIGEADRDRTILKNLLASSLSLSISLSLMWRVWLGDFRLDPIVYQNVLVQQPLYGKDILGPTMNTMNARVLRGSREEGGCCVLKRRPQKSERGFNLA